MCFHHSQIYPLSAQKQVIIIKTGSDFYQTAATVGGISSTVFVPFVIAEGMLALLPGAQHGDGLHQQQQGQACHPNPDEESGRIDYEQEDDQHQEGENPDGNSFVMHISELVDVARAAAQRSGFTV
jgi:hypothetical protein